MTEQKIIEMIVSLITGGLAAFFAIMCWPKTREPSWMFFIVGIVINFGALVFRALDLFGVNSIALEDPRAQEILRIIFYNLPYLLYSLGFLLKFRSRD